MELTENAKAEVERIIGLDTAVAAVDHLWNNEFDEAERVLAGTCGSVPRAADHFTEVQLLKCVLTGTASECAKLEARVKAQRALAEAHARSYGRGACPAGVEVRATGRERAAVLRNLELDARLALGDAMMMHAVMHFVSGSKVKALLQLRKSWRCFQATARSFGVLTHNSGKEEATEKGEATKGETATTKTTGEEEEEGETARATNPKDKTNGLHPELQAGLDFGLGFFYFVVSVIPGSFLRLARVAGFEADGPRGLALCRGVRAGSRLRMPFATVLLLFHLVIVPRGLQDVRPLLAEANNVVGAALARYPRGGAWHVLASQAARKQGDLAAGCEHCRLALEGARALGAEPATLAYEHAACHLMLLRWDDGARLLEPLARLRTFRLRGTAAVQAAAAHLMAGRADAARALWRDTPALIGRSHSATDASLARWAARYLQHGGHFAAFDILYIRRDLPKMARAADTLLALLDTQARTASILAPDGALVPAAPSTRRRVDRREASAAGATPAPKNPFRAIGAAFKKAAAAAGSKNSAASEEEDTVEVVDWTNDRRADYLLMRAALLKARDGLASADAVALLEQIPAMERVLVDRWFVPYAWFELCESYYNAARSHDAALALKRATAPSDYPWEDPLRVRARVTADHLKAALAKAHVAEEVATDDAEDVQVDANCAAAGEDEKDDDVDGDGGGGDDDDISEETSSTSSSSLTTSDITPEK